MGSEQIQIRMWLRDLILYISNISSDVDIFRSGLDLALQCTIDFEIDLIDFVMSAGHREEGQAVVHS